MRDQMKLHVGQGATVGAVTVFPVWHDRHVRAKRDYATGADALQVVEAGAVERLRAHNTGAVPVLVLDGQLFEGGWQHRMATRSMLVAPGAEVPVEVLCVEQHRWGGAQVQRTRGRRATTSVRAGADRGQQEVWRRVGSHGAAGRSASLAERLSSADVDEQARILRGAARPHSGQCGVLIGIGGQPVLLEVFDHPTTLREQFGGLLRAAVLDALGAPALPTPGRRARRLVERLARVRLDDEPDVGQLGRLSRGSTEHLDVASLRHSLRTVHLRATNRAHPLLQEAA